MKFTGGDTAESDTSEVFFIRQRKAGAVAGTQQLAVSFCQPPADNRSDRVQDIPARQVECRRDLRLSRRFIVPLLCHQLRTGKAELYARESVNGIVDAPVIRAKATEHLIVRGVDDGVAFQRCDTRAVNAGFVRAVDLGETKQEVQKVWQSLNSLLRDAR